MQLPDTLRSQAPLVCLEMAGHDTPATGCANMC